jgi:hypothetical protein
MRGSVRIPFVLAFPVLATVGALPAQTPVVATSAFGNNPFVFDQARQRLVVSMTAGALWEWDGVDWALSSATLPTSPTRAVYDPTRQRCFFLCAGRLVEFDGHAAIDRGALPLTTTGNFVVDTHRGRLLLCQTVNGATAGYEWDGTAWQAIPSPGPNTPALALGYDEARHCAVLQTITFQPSPLFHTWEWDGTAWAVRGTDSRVYAPNVFDMHRQQLVTFAAGVSYAWSGSLWTPINVDAPAGSVATADPANGRLWFYNQNAGGDRTRFWAYDGVQWTSPMRVPHPIEVTNSTPIVYDALRDRAVLVSGQNQLLHFEWDGTRWLSLPNPAGPASRTMHAFAYDAARGETVLFGGFTPTGSLADTWTWNGTQWRQAATSGPAARYRPAVTYDSLRARIVMIGGATGSTSFTDHWEWDGVAWTQIAATTPLGGTGGALGHDPVRDVLVHVDWSGTTFERGPAGWAMILPANPNLGSAGYPSLTWNPVRQRLQGEMGSISVPQLHEWTGSAWLPSGASYGATAWDSRRGVLLGYKPTQFVVGSPTPATVQEFGAPCGGTTTISSLTAFGRPRPGDSAFHVDVRAEAALRPGLVGYALAAGSTPLGNGCALLLQNPFGSAIWFLDAHGCWHHPLPLPGSLALRGITIVAQAAVLDPASPGGLAMTQGLSLTVGD